MVTTVKTTFSVQNMFMCFSYDFYNKQPLLLITVLMAYYLKW